MLEELQSTEKVVGLKQTWKAIRNGRASKVYLACDADTALISPMADACAQADIPVDTERSMAQLGHACGIAVGAATVALLKQ